MFSRESHSRAHPDVCREPWLKMMLESPTTSIVRLETQTTLQNVRILETEILSLQSSAPVPQQVFQSTTRDISKAYFFHAQVGLKAPTPCRNTQWHSKISYPNSARLIPNTPKASHSRHSQQMKLRALVRIFRQPGFPFQTVGLWVPLLGVCTNSARVCSSQQNTITDLAS